LILEIIGGDLEARISKALSQMQA